MTDTNCKDNIKISLKELQCEGVDWIFLAQDRGPTVGSSKYCNEASSSIKGTEFLD
jgi:hypothetical protein